MTAEVTELRLCLHGSPPYGFRIAGGDEDPVTVARVRQGSKAAQAGLIEGDVVLVINDFICKNLSYDSVFGLTEYDDDQLSLIVLRGRDNVNVWKEACEKFKARNRMVDEEEIKQILKNKPTSIKKKINNFDNFAFQFNLPTSSTPSNTSVDKVDEGTKDSSYEVVHIPLTCNESHRVIYKEVSPSRIFGSDKRSSYLSSDGNLNFANYDASISSNTIPKITHTFVSQNNFRLKESLDEKLDSVMNPSVFFDSPQQTSISPKRGSFQTDFKTDLKTDFKTDFHHSSDNLNNNYGKIDSASFRYSKQNIPRKNSNRFQAFAKLDINPNSSFSSQNAVKLEENSFIPQTKQPTHFGDKNDTFSSHNTFNYSKFPTFGSLKPLPKQETHQPQTQQNNTHQPFTQPTIPQQTTQKPFTEQSQPSFKEQTSQPSFAQQPTQPFNQQTNSQPSFAQQPTQPFNQQTNSQPSFAQQPTQPFNQQTNSQPSFAQQPTQPFNQQTNSQPSFKQQTKSHDSSFKANFFELSNEFQNKAKLEESAKFEHKTLSYASPIQINEHRYHNNEHKYHNPEPSYSGTELKHQSNEPGYKDYAFNHKGVDLSSTDYVPNSKDYKPSYLNNQPECKDYQPTYNDYNQSYKEYGRPSSHQYASHDPQSSAPKPPPCPQGKLLSNENKGTKGSLVNSKEALAKNMALSVMSDANRNSKGQKLFLMKRQNSEKYTLQSPDPHKPALSSPSAHKHDFSKPHNTNQYEPKSQSKNEVSTKKNNEYNDSNSAAHHPPHQQPQFDQFQNNQPHNPAYFPSNGYNQPPSVYPPYQHYPTQQPMFNPPYYPPYYQYYQPFPPSSYYPPFPQPPSHLVTHPYQQPNDFHAKPHCQSANQYPPQHYQPPVQHQTENVIVDYCDL